MIDFLANEAPDSNKYKHEMILQLKKKKNWEIRNSETYAV